MKINKSGLLSWIYLIVLFLAIIIISLSIPETTIRSAVEKSGPWGVALLIFFFWVANIIAPLSGSPFLFAGFYSYGQMVVIYAFIAALLASITNFWIAKIWGRKVVKSLAGEDNLKKIDELTSNYGLQTLFVFRIFLKEFHDVISYTFGLTKLEFTPYFIVSTLGMIPATVIWYAISLLIQDPITFTAISWAVPTISIGIYFAWVKYKRKK